MDLKKIRIDSSWSLFLDRDGLINERLIDDYVKNIGEFKLNPEFLRYYPIFRKIFHRIFIVTNQRGIARGVMSKADLEKIHTHLEEILEQSGGKPDHIYYCPHENNSCNCRKPEPGMGYFAKKDFPEIQFSKSAMIGDSKSDMLFGHNLGMLSVMYPDNQGSFGDLSFQEFISFLNHV
ncbi:MAG: HAD-IIIA family hydrolase [Spirochaetia bacterium]|nr:HAD-IIIA family hydrolase [Spirochaetia bacterium]